MRWPRYIFFIFIFFFKIFYFCTSIFGSPIWSHILPWADHEPPPAAPSSRRPGYQADQNVILEIVEISHMEVLAPKSSMVTKIKISPRLLGVKNFKKTVIRSISDTFISGDFERIRSRSKRFLKKIIK